jgi:hypothetical protein
MVTTDSEPCMKNLNTKYSTSITHKKEINPPVRIHSNLRDHDKIIHSKLAYSLQKNVMFSNRARREMRAEVREEARKWKRAKRRRWESSEGRKEGRKKERKKETVYSLRLLSDPIHSVCKEHELWAALKIVHFLLLLIHTTYYM